MNKIAWSAAKAALWIKVWAKSLFPHKLGTRIALYVFVLVLLGAFATKCQAAETGLVLEVGGQLIRGPAAAVAINVVSSGPRDTAIETGLFLVGRTPDHLGVMGGQALIVDGFGRLDLGIGLAYMNRLHEQLGSQLNFALMVRYRLTDRWYVAARHWSNAGTTEHNKGLDIVMVGYRF